MLIKLKCSDFKDKNGKPRPFVFFTKGLNAVTGHLGSSGSVGKSTFLMVIDFVFGGDDYIKKLKDIIHKYVPFHCITFTFEFGNEQYHFMRSTQESESVYIYDENHAPKEPKPWTIQKFRDWLFAMYSLPTDNPEMREHISRFFRVYHRGNTNEKRPLSFTSGGKTEAIDCILQLLGEPSFVYEKSELNKSKERLRVYNKATAFNFIPGGVTADDVAYNKEEIRRLQEELTKLIDREPSQLEALNIARDNERALAGLRSKLSFARQRRGQIESEITVIKRNAEFQRNEHFANSFEDLLEFFPNVNLPLITEIEAFHYKLAGMLLEEFEVAKNRLEEMFAIANGEISNIEAQITELGKKDKVAEDFARNYYAIQTDIDRLKKQNGAFELFLDLENTVKAQTERLKLIEEQKQAVLCEVSNKITDEMWRINEILCGDKLSAPSIRFNSLTNYTFNTFQDGGTSASYRGLAIFDLAVLSLTKLPAIAHDFVMLSQIELSHRENIFKYYSKLMDKQVFIALDEIETYTEPIKTLLEKSTVLTLTGIDEDVLFGKSWNSKEEQIHVQMTLFDTETTEGIDDSEAENEEDNETADE